MQTEPIRILVADDHSIVREGLRLILESQDGFEIVGEASDGLEAVALTAETTPDVVLMDLRMPGVDGIEAIRRISKTNPDAAVVILTTYDEDGYMHEGLRAGARGYLLKDTDRNTLYHTIRAAARGDTLLTSEVASKVFSKERAEASRGTIASSGPGRKPATFLTDREREVLGAVADGEPSRKIAGRLGISERTVKAHLASIYSKLGVSSRTGAVARALREGLVQLD